MFSLGNVLKIALNGQSFNSCVSSKRLIFKSSVLMFLDTRDKDHEKKSKELVVHQGQYFDEAAKKAKTKETFQEAVSLFVQKSSKNRRGHVEFLYAALARIDEFNAHRDIETYRKLLNIFPKYVMIPKNVWQVEFMHYPKHQQCCIDILDHMESNGVIPDDNLGYQLRDLFGQNSHVFRKYRRMMFWMPKFKYANPYYVPYDLPNDKIELAKLALKRMSVDLENEISVFDAGDLDSSVDKTFVVSSQSPNQRHLLMGLPNDEAIFVEGGFLTWLRSEPLKYFILKSNCTKSYDNFVNSVKKFDYKNVDESEEPNLYTFNCEPQDFKSLVIKPSIHEQEDGMVLGMCITGSSSKDSLASWVKFLEKTNCSLANIPVVFRLKSAGNDLEVTESDQSQKSSQQNQS